jgi:4-amino-4-deoxy-L-arabinose transferase-like glycosyltransferase
MLSKKSSTGNGLIAFLLACLTAILLTATAPAVGLTWDETDYITGADSYAAWFGVLVKHPVQALSTGVIDQYWTASHEHPPVEKIWAGLVWTVARHFFDDLTANRVGAMLVVALLVALLYLLVAPNYGKVAGLFAVLALLSMPRFFFHAHLAALDVPVAVAVFAVTFLFWKTIDRKEWCWGLILGVAWGLAVAVKLNGVFVPIALVIWCLVNRRTWAMALRFFLMGVSAFGVFLLVWPWLYHQTWERILDYLDYQIRHYPIGQWFLGKYYLPPPWTFVPVILIAVVPLTILVLSFVGMARAGKGKKDRGLVWLLIISALVSISPFLIGKSLLYDDDRLFMPVYPFLATLAGIGFGWIVDGLSQLMGRLKRPALSVPLSLLFGVAMLFPQAMTMATLYPHLLSYYSESVDGLRGATKMGLETTYWCETYAAALPYINAHAHPGDSIWIEPGSFDVLLYYQMHGQLRKDVHILTDPLSISVLGQPEFHPIDGNIFAADWIIFAYHQSGYGPMGENYLPLKVIKSRSPVVEVSYQGVPLMDLYTRIK